MFQFKTYNYFLINFGKSILLQVATRVPLKASVQHMFIVMRYQQLKKL